MECIGYEFISINKQIIGDKLKQEAIKLNCNVTKMDLDTILTHSNLIPKTLQDKQILFPEVVEDHNLGLCIAFLYYDNREQWNLNLKCLSQKFDSDYVFPRKII